MRRIANQFKFGHDETGMILIYVIMVLVLALLVVPPVLEFGFGSHRTAQIREDRMLKVYAADAGIEHAYYSIKSGNITYDYTLDDINGYDVHVQIEDLPGAGLYEILSTAYGGQGANVTIESHTGTTSYGGFFNNVLTSQGDISIQPGSYVEGNVTLNGRLRNRGTLVGNVSYDVPEWPEPEDLRDHYWPQVENEPFPYPVPLEIPGNETVFIGPCYEDASLIIQGTNTGEYGNLTLTGTLYVQGDLTIGGIGGKYLNLRLEGQTIYVEGNLVIYQEVELFGPGCIIAEGEVDFMPHQASNDFVFVMSVTQNLKARPNGNFFGSFAGIAQIDLQPGYSIKWITYPKDELGDPLLNYPGFMGSTVRIMDYIIRD